MVPALLLLAQSLFAAAPAAPRHALPDEKRLRSEAASWVGALCSTGKKDKCQAAREALAGYETLLPQTARCEAGPCGKARIESLARSLAKINATVGALPAVRGRTLNSLLRLGALGGVRLAAAAERVHESLPVAGDFDQAAPASVEAICLESPGNACDLARLVLQSSRQYSAEAADCRKSACPFSRIDDLALDAQDNVDLSLRDLPGVKTSQLPLFSVASRALHDATGLLARFVDQDTARLRAGADAYEKRVAAAEKDSSADARALPGEAQTLMASYQEASYAADRLEHLLGYAPSAGAKREALNTQARRLGALRARAFAAVTARGLGSLPMTQALAALGVPVPPGPAKLKPGVVLSTVKPTLLDGRALPPPTGAGPPPPPILAKDPGLIQTALNLTAKDPLARADAERRLHLSQTVGSPGTYAPYVYEQAASNTCAVAAQVEALRALGMLPRGVKPQVQEKQAADMLARKAYFDDGTYKAYEGELLISKGMLVDKHVDAQWPQLEAAIRRGSLIQAAVDARFLWHMERFPREMSHSILVTGGEVERGSGKLLGVYINDSGDDPPKGGRFVPIETFRKAWEKMFVEVIR